MHWALAIIGAVVVARGIMLEAAAASAMHQIYSGVYITGGLILIGLACVCHAVTSLEGRLSKLQQGPETKPGPEFGHATGSNENRKADW